MIRGHRGWKRPYRTRATGRQNESLAVIDAGRVEPIRGDAAVSRLLDEQEPVAVGSDHGVSGFRSDFGRQSGIGRSEHLALGVEDQLVGRAVLGDARGERLL